MSIPLWMLILEFLYKNRKWVKDTELMTEFNVEKFDVNTATSVLVNDEFVESERYSSEHKWFRINDAGISFYYKISNEIIPVAKVLSPIVNETSHREIIIAHSFKVKARLETDKTAAQWVNERGKKARQLYYTTLKQSKNYKEPTKQELLKVIELLKDFPSAQKMAINKLAELESL